MATHAKDALRGAGISQVLNLALTVPTTEAGSTKGLVSSENSHVLDFIIANSARICTIVAYQRAVSKKQEVGIGVEQGAACVASEAVEMPSVTSCWNKLLAGGAEGERGRRGRQGVRQTH